MRFDVENMSLNKLLLIPGILILAIPLTLSADCTATTQLQPPKLIAPSQNLLTQAQPKRIALVIGNSHYPGTGELRSPVNDANTISNNLATILAVELVNNNTQLLIMADRGVKATSSWDNSEGVYRITIPSAQLATLVKGPQLDANSPVVKVRLKQQQSGTVEITVQPAAGVLFGQLSQISEQVIGLQLLRNGQAQIPSSNPIPTPTSVIPSGRVVPSSKVPARYKKLRNLLAAKRWKEADAETRRVMLVVAKKKTYHELYRDDIEKFPCSDLRGIDQLWVKYSKGRFGFSVQAHIYQSLGGPGDADPLSSIWAAYGIRIGWYKHKRWFYHPTFNLTAKFGHLPGPRELSAEDAEENERYGVRDLILDTNRGFKIFLPDIGFLLRAQTCNL